MKMHVLFYAIRQKAQLLWRCFFSLILSVLFVMSPVYAIQFEITDLNPDGYDTSVALGINNNGDVAGQVDGYVTLWNNNSAQVLSYTGWGADINDNGQMTGNYTAPGDDIPHAFIWQNETLATLSPQYQSTGLSISNNGTVAGFIDVADQGRTAVTWAPAQTQATGLQQLPSQRPFSTAFGISNNGQYIAGTSQDNRIKPVVWEAGGIDDLYDAVDQQYNVSRYRHGYAYDVNDSGTAVGNAVATIDGDLKYAAVWKNGQVQFINNEFYSAAFAVNANDQVVGNIGTAQQSFPSMDDLAQQPFYWSQDNGCVNLNDLIPDDSGWQLKGALDINDNGQIVGWGITANGQRHAFLLDPVEQWSAISNNDELFDDSISETQIDALYALWLDGKNGLTSQTVTIGEQTWEYFDEEYTDRTIGETWIADGYKYLYLGSGIRTKINDSVPEPATLMLLGISIIAFLGKQRLR